MIFIKSLKFILKYSNIIRIPIIGDVNMIKFLVRRFIKDHDNISDKKVRETYGVLGGILGIICNIFLFLIKLTIGLVMNSIAIISDAVNNLSDIGSSFVTVIGSKLSNRRPDKEHPFGHGRLEYISSLLVSLIIVIVGFELLKTSFEKIIHPEKMEFSLVLIIILSLSVFVKVWMFSYNKYLGTKINSSVLKATARDSLNDVIATSAVIVSTIIGNFVDLPIDGVVGLLVSGLVMYSGFGIAKDTIGVLLGTPPSEELVAQIDKMILDGDGIIGVHDLIIHDYGPGRVMASAHAEVPDDISIVKIHEVIDGIEQSILNELGIHIVIHMDPLSVNCEQTDEIKNIVKQIIKQVNPKFSIHDFRLTNGESRINLIFDLEIPCDMKDADRKSSLLKINELIHEEDERYNTVIKVDNSFKF